MTPDPRRRRRAHSHPRPGALAALTAIAALAAVALPPAAAHAAPPKTLTGWVAVTSEGETAWDSHQLQGRAEVVLTLKYADRSKAGYEGTGTATWTSIGRSFDCHWNLSGTTPARFTMYQWLSGSRRGEYSIEGGWEATQPGCGGERGSGGLNVTQMHTATDVLQGSQTQTGDSWTNTQAWSFSGASRPPCTGDQASVSGVTTKSRRDYGLAGAPLRKGATIRAPEQMTMRFGDGSTLRLARDASVRVVDCSTGSATRPLTFKVLLGTVWAAVEKALGGKPPAYQTERAVTGVRGTAFRLSYDQRRRLTTVQVTKGSVTLRNRTGPRKRTVVVTAGRTATQCGSAVPQLRPRR